jgi:hypothetical protein
MKAAFICANCGKASEKEAGAINRANAGGFNLYCSRECSSIGRRKGKTPEQLKAEKKAYDEQYRAKNRARLKAQKAAYYAKTADREKEREIRKERMPQHVEYCRRPEYRAKKHEYDRQYRAREYGQFGDAYLLLVDIQKEVLSRASRYEIDLANGKLNKRRKRKDECHN